MLSLRAAPGVASGPRAGGRTRQGLARPPASRDRRRAARHRVPQANQCHPARSHDPSIPDLATLERQGRLVFVPFGGGDIWLWTTRLAGLGLSEFHLYDREGPPETEMRQKAADVVNLRPNCRAVITNKRSLENYVHPAAIREACGIELEFSDDDPVADLLAQRLYQRDEPLVPWAELPRRAKTRRRNRVKKWLHTKALDHMTCERLAQRDPQGEVRSWLETIARLAGRTG